MSTEVGGAVRWLAMLLVWGGCIAPTDPVAVGGSGGGGGAPTGSVEIAVSTTGSSLDSDGYQLLFNEANTYAIGANASLTLMVSAGNYQVRLVDLASNCEVEGSANPQAFSVTGGATTTVSFAVVCTDLS